MIFNSGRINNVKLALFFESMSFLARSGLNPTDSVKSLLEEGANSIGEKFLSSVHALLSDGLTLADAAREVPSLKPYWRQISVAQRTGRLAECLERITAQIKGGSKIKSKIRSASVYPLTLLVLALGIMLYLLNTVVPQISEMLSEFDTEMPTLTLAMIGLQKHIQTFWYLDIVVLAALIAGMTLLIKGPLSLQFAKLILKLPIVKLISVSVNYSLMYALLCDMIANGSPDDEALRIAATACSNKFIVQELIACEQLIVVEGRDLCDALQSSTTMPSQDKLLLRVAKASGRQQFALRDLAEHSKEVSENVVGNLTEMLSPIMMVLVGGIIGVIVFAVYMPILSLTTAI